VSDKVSLRGRPPSAMADNEKTDGAEALHELYDDDDAFLSSLPSEVEFWSAIIGALPSTSEEESLRSMLRLPPATD
jgi:hypothetical protein